MRKHPSHSLKRLLKPVEARNPEMKATYKATTASDGSYQLKRRARASESARF